ncbi:protein FAM149A-like isoform X1 [Stegostoma tigrinum]|uniref:protein FAM149A-like isoform X1 n=1 Tax=Stegostoma tigrinum TaxID=3053191 RepID=UPI0028700B0E|nr:protein FAM149A-like isoform X1 [Stegostoma tigrinum]
MKLAVLDLGTIFANIFKTSASPVIPPAGSSNSGQSATPHGPSAISVSSSLSGVSGKASGLSGSGSAPGSPVTVKNSSASFPASASVPKSAGLSVGTASQIAVRAAPSSGLASLNAVKTMPSPTGSNNSIISGTGRSPVYSVEDSVTWKLSNKQHPFTLPNIGEEGVTDTDSAESSSEKKGISKGDDSRRFVEKTSDSLPANFTKHVQGAIQSYNSNVSIVSESLSGQTTPIDLNHSWSAIQSYTTSLSTERSSVYSWRDDEFDKANTRTVHQLFWEIDEMLFEGKVSSRTESIQTECQEWTERSPQLRILGTQLLLPKDEGFQHFQSGESSSIATRKLSSFCDSTGNMKELSLSGLRLLPVQSPYHNGLESNSTLSSLDSDSSVFSFLEEEIFDVDGKIEEYFAYDGKECFSDDESLEQKNVQLARRRNKRGIPPISPNACIKDAASAEIFDDIWRDVIEMTEELIRKQWENTLSDRDKQTVNMQNAIMNKLPRINDSRIIVTNYGIPPSRGSETRVLALGTSFIHSQAYRMTNAYRNDLNGVMTIQAKPLQQRHAGLPDKTQFDQNEKQFSTGSSILSTIRNRLGRSTDYSVLSASRIMQVSSRKTGSQRKLPSLSSELLKAKAANVYSDEILRGTKLANTFSTYKSSQYVESTAKVSSGVRHQSYQHLTLKRYIGTDRPSSPPVHTTRINQLPPIHTESTEVQLPLPGSRYQLRGRFSHSRVSSATGEGTGRRTLRERLITIDTSSRPNTTHTFRSDTPFKRSFTPMDYTSHTRTRRASFTDHAGIGVTGISLGISASSSNYPTDFAHQHHHQLNQPPIEGDEDEYRTTWGPQAHFQSKPFNRLPTNSRRRPQVVS